MAINTTELQSVYEPGFSYPGLASQPMLPAIVDAFDNFAKIEANLPASVAAKDNVNMTVNDKAYAARHNVTTWTATSFGLGAVVQYLGKFYWANAATVAGDVPGASAKWNATGAPYIS